MRIVLLVFAVTPLIGNAACYITWNCGGSWQCAQLYGGSSGRRGPLPSCNGWVKQDADSACTCDNSTGPGTTLNGGDPATQIGTQLGNLLWQGITEPAKPKSPEELEAERQAELLRQKQEAERQAKIQKYLDDEAAKQRQKDAALDKEAADSLSLLSNKPVTMSDDELLGQNDRPEPRSCTEELEKLSSGLRDFANEATSEGYRFLANDIQNQARQTIDQVKTMGAEKMGVKQYAKDYKIIKTQVDNAKQKLGYLEDIRKCLDTKGCSLIEFSKKYDQEFKDWLKTFATKDLKEAADRVDKASSFLQNYNDRLEKQVENITSNAANCLGR